MTICLNSSTLDKFVVAVKLIINILPSVRPTAEIKSLFASAVPTSSGVILYPASLTGSNQTRIAIIRGPNISATCTPLIDCILGCTTRVR